MPDGNPTLHQAGGIGERGISVKLWYILVLGGIFVAGGTYIYLHRQDLGLTWLSGTSSTGQAPSPTPITWAMVDRSSEGFTLEMPQDARETEAPAFAADGTATQVEMICAYPDPSTSYSISWADNPPVVAALGGDPDQTLEDARNGALARTQSVLVSEAQSTRQGFPVRDFTSRNQNGGVFNARLILADRRLYMLMASFPAASARRDDDVNRFFDSFRVVSTTAPQ